MIWMCNSQNLHFSVYSYATAKQSLLHRNVRYTFSKKAQIPAQDSFLVANGLALARLRHKTCISAKKKSNIWVCIMTCQEKWSGCAIRRTCISAFMQRQLPNKFFCSDVSDIHFGKTSDSRSGFLFGSQWNCIGYALSQDLHISALQDLLNLHVSGAPGSLLSCQFNSNGYVCQHTCIFVSKCENCRPCGWLQCETMKNIVCCAALLWVKNFISGLSRCLINMFLEKISLWLSSIPICYKNKSLLMSLLSSQTAQLSTMFESFLLWYWNRGPFFPVCRIPMNEKSKKVVLADVWETFFLRKSSVPYYLPSENNRMWYSKNRHLSIY